MKDIKITNPSRRCKDDIHRYVYSPVSMFFHGVIPHFVVSQATSHVTLRSSVTVSTTSLPVWRS